jgi:NTE family protein
MHNTKFVGLYLLFAILFCHGVLAQPAPKKIGLVLSGGGARGAAHIGVLKVLERERIPIDYIAGTSFGALVGGLYACGYSAEEIEKLFKTQDWDRMFTDLPERRLSPLAERRGFRYQGQLYFDGFSPELPPGLWNGQKITELLNSLTTAGILAADYDFDRLRIPFRAVATNLLDGKQHVFRRGSMTEAMRASLAIPMVFSPVEKEGMLLVDGGLANNIPCDVAREMGAEIIIASDATATLLKKDEIRDFFDVVDQSLSLLMYQNQQKNADSADLLIQPDLGQYTYRDYGSIPDIIVRGEQAAEKSLAAIEKLTVGIERRAAPAMPALENAPVISQVSFEGLKAVSSRQLAGEVRAGKDQPLNPETLRNDLSRLYATRLFDTVGYNLKPLADNRYQLNFLCREAPRQTLGASLRYDRDYAFVALAEFTARQLFHTPSTFTLSTQFGGYEQYSATLRYIPTTLRFLFVEPSVHYVRRERLDIRDQNVVDKYADKRSGGSLTVGGTFLKRLEFSASYRDDSVSISGGSPPNRMKGAERVSGLTFRLNRDNLDAQEFPHSGNLFTFQFDQRNKALGGDVEYEKWQAGMEQYLSITGKTTIGLRAGAGFSRKTLPFYERFFVGGYNASIGASSHLLGYRMDELTGQQVALGGASFRHELFGRPLSFIRRGYAVGIYNVAGISEEQVSPYRWKYFNGGAIGLALDTLLGPFRIMAGFGESGRVNLYLSLGPGF